MHEVSRPWVLMLDCYSLAIPCTCAPVCLWAYVLACNRGKFNFTKLYNRCPCYSCLTSSSCIMCIDATALSAEIDKDIWQTCLTSGTTSCSQTSQLEGMRLLETVAAASCGCSRDSKTAVSQLKSQRAKAARKGSRP
jgi:hypothetical protein